jgi:hypothetical protein
VAAAAAARHDDVPVVLDGVVGAAGEEAGDERPPVAVGAVGLQEPLLLRRREGTPVDLRVQLVEPPETAALPCQIDQLAIWHAYHVAHIYMMNGYFGDRANLAVYVFP